MTKHQFFIIENNLQRVGQSFFFTCPVRQPWYKIFLSGISFHWYRTIGQTLMSRPVVHTKFDIFVFILISDWLISVFMPITYYFTFYRGRGIWGRSWGSTQYTDRWRDRRDNLNLYWWQTDFCRINGKLTSYIWGLLWSWSYGSFYWFTTTCAVSAYHQ